MIDSLKDESRLILRAKLKPTVGSFFQPTGFPDLGAAEFKRILDDGTQQDALLVESVQSMANRLEANCWDSVENHPVDVLSGLPYVEVHDQDGNFLTSSRLEPHRLAGSYLRQGKIDGESGDQWLFKQIGLEPGRPTDWHAFYRALFELDPLCLLHGVFFSSNAKEWKDIGNPKVRRAISAVIEAHGVEPVVSGGVKRDDVNPTKGESRGSSEGFGFVPFGRTEYTAEKIELSVVVDLEQIRGYGLPDNATQLLTAISLWEIRSLLDSPLRLRTACDLELSDDVKATRPSGWTLPEADDLEKAIAGSDSGGSDPTLIAFE